jgi:hypothetical protein
MPEIVFLLPGQCPDFPEKPDASKNGTAFAMIISKQNSPFVLP